MTSTAYAPSESGLPASAPRALGAYELLRCIGQGGAARIYAARHPDHGMVAIKLPDAESAFDAFVDERLDREANLTSRVRHPNVLRTIETGTSEHGRFLVMELLHGDDLEVVMERHGAFDLHVACEIVRQTLLALEAVHTAGIVHRDLKPTNLVLDTAHRGATPRVKLIDFGVARSYDGVRLTMAGTVVGTPQYLAPEQAKGELADERADLWAVGLIFYELLAARAPFEGRSLHETLSAILFSDVPDVRQVRPDVPEDVARVIARALRREPEDRFESARRMLDALEHAVDLHGLERGERCLGQVASLVDPWTTLPPDAAESTPPATPATMAAAAPGDIDESPSGSGIRRLALKARHAPDADVVVRRSWPAYASESMPPLVSTTARAENTTNTASMANTMHVSRPPSGAESDRTSDTGSARRVGWGRAASINGFDDPASSRISYSGLYAPSAELTPRPDSWDRAVVASPFLLGFFGLCVIAFGAGIAVHETHLALASHHAAHASLGAARAQVAAVKPPAHVDSKDYVLHAMATAGTESAAPILLAANTTMAQPGSAAVTATAAVRSVAHPRTRGSRGSSRRWFARRHR